MTTWMCGYHGYSPEHLCELSLEQRYDDGEADARRDQVEKSGLWAGRQTGGQRDRRRETCRRAGYHPAGNKLLSTFHIEA